ncbi:MAG: NAAT family transporter [Candidatus Melainabacteria bacterium]|nr:NAAT family transporter [Candidatus Melainabacteria bacterium]
MEYHEYIKYFISLLVICSPFSALPALLSLSQGHTTAEKKRTGTVAAVAVGIILIGVTWIGGPILHFLGITVPAFQVAGGFVIFLLALSMLNAETSRMKQTTEDQKEVKHKHSVAIVPLAIPLMAGPGAISTVIVAVNAHGGLVHMVFFSFCAIAVAIVLGITLYFAAHFEKMLGQTGINIVNRLAGLILAAMAIETLSKGLIGLFPFLASKV